MPQELLELIITILLLQELDEHLDPKAAVADNLTADGANIVGVRGKDIGSQQGAQIDDGLLRRRHVPIRKSTDHLVCV